MKRSTELRVRQLADTWDMAWIIVSGLLLAALMGSTGCSGLTITTLDQCRPRVEAKKQYSKLGAETISENDRKQLNELIAKID